MRRIAFLTALVVLGLGLAACGGGGGKGGTATSTPGATKGTPAPTVPSVPQPTVQRAPTVTASGLKIYDIQVGTGAAAKATDSLTVRYTAWLADGTTIDTSALHGGTVSFPLAHVIQGWREGVVGMQVGGKRRLIVPPSLAYGTTGKGAVPPNATLTFDIELVSIP